MPWRSKTLTKYVVGGSDDASVDSDNGWQRVGVDLDVGSPGNPVGAAASDEVVFGPGSADWHCNSDLDDSSVVHGAGGQLDKTQGAIDLGASQVPRGPTLSQDNFEQFLSHAFLSTRGSLKVRMPWEKGVFKSIFKKPDSGRLEWAGQPRQWVEHCMEAAVEPLDELSVAMCSRPQLVGAYFEHALASGSDQSFFQQRQSLLESAVEKWFCIIRVNMLASAVGRDIIGLGNMDIQKKGAFQVIEAVIGIRSRTTAITRANALLKFIRWRAETSENDGREFSEMEAWQYLTELREKNAAPTRGSSFLSACAYAVHVFGFAGLGPICESRRLKGLAEIMHAEKAPLKQARVLTVNQVRWLHDKLQDGDCNTVDRAVIAYLLVALYGRCRHSDLQNVEEVALDFGDECGYMEVSTRTHKTARSAAQKSRLLPIVIPAVGITGCEWLSAAKVAFENFGLEFEGRVGGPFFRPPGSDGNTHCRRGLTSHEVTKFLRLMLEGDNVNQSEPRVSSHSLKATLLSWAAKSGMSPADRAILGRHSSAYLESSAVYARDLAFGAVHRLQDVLRKIHSGEFLPDAPRSGYHPVASVTVEPTEPVDCQVVKVEDEVTDPETALVGPEEAVVIDDEPFEASSDGSESVEDSDSSEEVPKPQVKCFRHHAVGPLAGLFVMHNVSKLVHYSDPAVLDGKGARMISCGRSLNQNYKYTTQFDSVDMCKRCKSNAVKDNALPKALG